MKIAIYTLTRDRLDYTKYCFDSLAKKAGCEYDHYIVDNGSQDGTIEWLKENENRFKKVIYNSENQGIGIASNQALKAIFGDGHTHTLENYDIVIKMDNDCELLSDNLLTQVAEIYEDLLSKEFECKYVLSPYVEGIVNQPNRGRFAMYGGRRIGLTAIVGGLFHIVPADVYRKYCYPSDLPKAWGQDDAFCKWIKDNGGQVGYIEDLKVNHFETTAGQAARYPEYFKRKHEEEKL